MNRGCPAQRFHVPRLSTCSTTAASKPMPQWNRKYRPSTAPSPILVIAPRSRASRSWPAASIGSSGRPMMRANTLVLPPGRAARAVSVPARPLAASLSVPSPPSTTTTSVPSEAAERASRVAWPRRAVSASVTSWSADRAFWITTRRRPVTDDAAEFTSSRTRIDPVCPLAGPAAPQLCGRSAHGCGLCGWFGVRFWPGAGTIGAHEGCRLREADPRSRRSRRA